MKLIFTAILLIHGLIHFLGTVYEWKLSPVKQFKGRNLFKSPKLSKTFGLAWLIITLLFLFSALAYLLKIEYWWLFAIISVILSQALLVIYWKDAKAGTILNVIIFVITIIGYGSWKMDSIVEKEVQEIFARNPATSEQISHAEIFKSLPACVQTWLIRSQVPLKDILRTVRLKQKGEMNMKKGGKWMPFEAEQYFTVQRPAFIWEASINAGAGFFINARDKYDKGLGNMWIQALSLYTIANSTGKEIDQGSLLRYLAEMVWVPSGVISPYISWTAVDSVSARATMSYKNVTASGLFTFNAEGDVVSFDALRYGEFDGKSLQKPWHISCGNYKEFEGIRIPTVCEVTWKLQDGYWTWLKLKVTEVQYNNKSLYKK